MTSLVVKFALHIGMGYEDPNSGLFLLIVICLGDSPVRLCLWSIDRLAKTGRVFSHR
jgi:hypothetical protein